MTGRTVCMFGNYAHYSGALEVFRNVARRLRENGWSFTYLYHMRPEREVRPDMSMFDNVVYVNEDVITREELAKNCAEVANRHDVVHTSLIPLHWRFLFKAMCRRPIIETYHSKDGWSHIWKSYRERLGGGVERMADFTVAVSEGLARKIASDTGAQVQMIRNGVEAIPMSGVARSRSVIYSGRISNGKGLDQWMETACVVRSKDPTVSFDWYGDLSPFDESWLFKTLRDGCPWLKCPGFTEDMRPVYESGGALLLTSPSEGLPMCILEAMSHGMPAVAYPVGDIPESGCVTVRNSGEAANAVLAALDTSHDDRFAMAMAAREKFSADRMASQYEDLYKSCLLLQ